MKHVFRADNKWNMVFGAISILLIAFMFWLFGQKVGCHSDEVWSYGFANSFYNPHIYAQKAEDIYTLHDAKIQNFEKWTDGKVFRDYLVVNEGEQFRYDSIYSNKIGDASPFLYEMILHTICSFFSGQFSWYFAFSINIVCFAMILLSIYCFVKNMSQNEMLGILAVLFYGFSIAGGNTIIFCRMYALLTAITMLFLLCLQQYYDNKETKKTYFALAIITCAGGLTHFYYYIFAFGVSALTCILYAMLRKWKKMLRFAICMLVGVLASFVIYPYSILIMLNDQNAFEGRKYFPYWYNLECCLDIFSFESVGFGWKLDRFVLLDTAVACVFLCITACLVLFLTRNETMGKKALHRIRECKNWIKNYINNDKKNGGLEKKLFIVNLLAAIIFTICLITRFSDVESMKEMMDRYMFFVQPIWMIIVLYWAYRFWNGLLRIIIKKTRMVKLGVVLVLLVQIVVFEVCQRSACDYWYLYRGNDEEICDLLELTENKKIVLVTGSEWQLQYYTGVCYNCDQFFAMRVDRWEKVLESQVLNNLEEGMLILVPEAWFKWEKMPDENDYKKYMQKAMTDITVSEFVDEIIEANGNDILCEQIEKITTFIGCIRIYEVKNKTNNG